MTFPFAKLADIHTRDVGPGHAHPYHFHRQIRVRGDQRQRRIRGGRRGFDQNTPGAVDDPSGVFQALEQGVELPGERVSFNLK